MLNLNFGEELRGINNSYLGNIFSYFFSVSELEFIYITGMYYLIQDYFLVLLSYIDGFVMVDNKTKDEFKFLFIFLIFVSFLF